MSHDAPLELGERIVAQGRWLRLLLMHLAGRQVRARVELEDLSQEVYVRAIAHADQLSPEEPAEIQVAGGRQGLRVTLAPTRVHPAVTLWCSGSLERRVA